MSHDKPEQFIFIAVTYEIRKFTYTLRLLTFFLHLVSVSCSLIVIFLEETTDLGILNVIAFEVQKTGK